MSATASLWCEYALIGEGVQAGVTVEVLDGVIVSVTPGCARPAGAEVLAGLTMPGFANAHSHAFHRALRGRTHHGPGDFWTWRSEMYAVADLLNPDNYLALATAVFTEMLQTGMTCVGEFHYVHHQPGGASYNDPNAMGLAIIEAARQTGIRLTLLDTCYLQGGFGTELNPSQQRFSDTSVQNWAERVALLAPGPDTRVGAAIHSVRAVPGAAIGEMAAFAGARRMPLHAHVSEQPAENEQTLAAIAMTPLRLLAESGALTPQFTAVHATHLTHDDIHLLAGAGATVCLCPTTERDLADGIGPSLALAQAGVPLCSGSDQHSAIDPFEEMRAIELNQRLATLRRGNHSVAELYAAGTRSGYAALGWNGGELCIGALADLVTIDTHSVRLAGTRPNDWPAAVVFAAGPSDVRSVIVGGRTVVRDGRHVRLDAEALLHQAISELSANR